MLKLCPIFDYFSFSFARTKQPSHEGLRTKNPTTVPTATAPLVFTPPGLGDVEFAFIFVPSVDLDIGSSQWD